MSLPDTLRALADTAPPPAVPPGLFDQARRRQRRQRVAALAVVVVLVAASAFGVGLAANRPAPVTAGAPGLPSEVFDPPQWTAGLRDGATGPAGVAFWGPAVADKPFRYGTAVSIALVGLERDTYRVVYPSQPQVPLSPDGRTALLPELDQSTKSMTADDWRTDALDLVTGQRRTVATRAVPLNWSADGRHLVLVKPYYWPDAAGTEGPVDVVSVVAWPSGQLEWSIPIARPHAFEGESNWRYALSPDAARLAVTTSGQLRVYGRDGVIQWQRDNGWDLLAGPAAWREDGRLALLRCVGCTAAPGFDPLGWRLELVHAQTGEPEPVAPYPIVRATNVLRQVAWRGETAYVVTGPSLVSLTPGAPAPVTVLSMPPEVKNFTVASGYVDAIRPAGSPVFGFDPLQLLAIALDGLRVAAYAGVVLLLILWVRRRRIERTRVPPAP